MPDSLPTFDLKILTDIFASEQGWSPYEIKDKFGWEGLESAKLLEASGFIKKHEHDLAPFLPGMDYHDPPKGNYVITTEGKLVVRRFLADKQLSSKECWKERIFSFFSGVLVTLLAEWLIRRLV